MVPRWMCSERHTQLSIVWWFCIKTPALSCSRLLPRTLVVDAVLWFTASEIELVREFVLYHRTGYVCVCHYTARRQK